MSRSTTLRLSIIASIACALAVALPRAVPAAAQDAPAKATDASTTYGIDDTHSMAIFRVRHMGAGAFWGMFNDLKGTVTYSPGADLALDVSIDTQSVDSNNAKLDQHLKSPDFFNAKEYPSMTFKSVSSKSLGEDRFEVSGDLTIRGKAKRVSVQVTCLGVADMGMGARAGFEAEFTINRSEFGVSYGADKGAVSDATRVIVAIEGVAKKAAPAGS